MADNNIINLMNYMKPDVLYLATKHDRPDINNFEEDPFEVMDSIESATQGTVNPIKIENAEKYAVIAEEMLERYLNRNDTDEFSDLFNEFHLTASLVNIRNKYKKLRMLADSKIEMDDAEIENTLMDIANDAVMTVMELRKNKEEK